MSVNKNTVRSGIPVYETVSGSLYTSNLEADLIKLCSIVIQGSPKLFREPIGKYVGFIHNKDAFVYFAKNEIHTYAKIIYNLYPNEKFIEIRKALESENFFLRAMPRLLNSNSCKKVEEIIIFESFDNAKKGHILVAELKDKFYYYT